MLAVLIFVTDSVKIELLWQAVCGCLHLVKKTANKFTKKNLHLKLKTNGVEAKLQHK